jgi:hypothetical protein
VKSQMKRLDRLERLSGPAKPRDTLAYLLSLYRRTPGLANVWPESSIRKLLEHPALTRLERQALNNRLTWREVFVDVTDDGLDSLSSTLETLVDLPDGHPDSARLKAALDSFVGPLAC